MKSFFILLSSVLGFNFTDTASFSPRVDPNCPDIDLATQCEDECITKVAECIADCATDASCTQKCYRDEIACVDSCPCHADCPQGCFTCLNLICFPGACDQQQVDENYSTCLFELQDILGTCTFDCYKGPSNETNDCVIDCSETFYNDHENCPCMAKCPDGCPCPEDTWECPEANDPDELAVLVLQHAGGNNKLEPFIVDFNGNVNNKVTFNFEDNTDLYGSCTVFYSGDWLVFGGNYQKRQVSKLRGCDLHREVMNIPFDFYYGTCGVFNLGIDVALLCFYYNDWKGCWSFNGDGFGQLPGKTARTHQYAKVANYQGQPFVVGGSESGNKYSERLGFLGLWESDSDWPFSNRIYNYATISKDDHILIIGGYTSEPLEAAESDIVAKFADGLVKWTTVGTLKQRRYYHSAIENSKNQILVVGGSNLRDTEELMLEENGNYRSYLSSPQLYNYQNTPLLMLVDFNYCTIPGGSP